MRMLEQIKAEILKLEDLLLYDNDEQKKDTQKKIDELMQEYQDLLIKKGEL